MFLTLRFIALKYPSVGKVSRSKYAKTAGYRGGRRHENVAYIESRRAISFRKCRSWCRREGIQKWSITLTPWSCTFWGLLLGRLGVVCGLVFSMANSLLGRKVDNDIDYSKHWPHFPRGLCCHAH